VLICGAEKRKRKEKEMKRSSVYYIAISALFILTALGVRADVILAGWDYTVNPAGKISVAAGVVEDGISAGLTWNTNANWTANYSGSIDGTFGSLATGATTNTGIADTGGYVTKSLANNDYLDIAVTNNGAQAIELTYLCFDAWRAWNSGPGVFYVSIVGGDITLTNNFATGVFVIQNANPQPYVCDFQDIDISLAGLADHTLASGESVVVRLAIDRTANPTLTGSVTLDNIAVLGTIPEPATLGLMIVSMAGVFGVRAFRTIQ